MAAQMVIAMLPRALECCRRVREVLDARPSVIDPAEGDAVDMTDRGPLADGEVLAFDDVTFRFANAEEDTLRHISFKARIGETVAIIGATGSGKSTIAQASAFIEQSEHGVATKVAQGGTNFSGGQRQRLSIARALVGDAQLVIFDDSFSALDFATDAALHKALREHMRDRAVLIIAQHVSTIAHADRIIVLDDGHVAGEGTHGKLLRDCAVYQEVVASQTNESEHR